MARASCAHCVIKLGPIEHIEVGQYSAHITQRIELHEASSKGIIDDLSELQRSRVGIVIRGNISGLVHWCVTNNVCEMFKFVYI